MSNKLPLSNVSSPFGSPMGRLDCLPKEGDNPAPKLRMERLEFVDQCYDKGGAYWGLPENIYYALNKDKGIRVFVRANDREEAKLKVRMFIPNATFYR